MEIESSGMTPGGPTRSYQCLTVRAGANVKQVAEFQVAGLHDMMMENPPTCASYTLREPVRDSYEMR